MSRRPLDLQRYGPWAIVTGASSGIGEQFARLLAEQGFHLVLVARRAEVLTSLCTELQSSGAVQVESLTLDLSQAGAADQLAAFVEGKDVGLLVSNAGFGLKGEFTEQPLERIEQMVQLNSVLPMQLAYLMLPRLKARGCGGIIFTGSIEGETAFPYSTAYAASKAFLHSLGNGLWQEMQAYGVDVLVLSPGSTDTQAPILQGISRDQLLGVMPPVRVADEALAALGSNALLIPGWHNRLFIAVLRYLPRNWSARLAGLGMKKAIENSRSQLTKS